jgi:hypothetical protein
LNDQPDGVVYAGRVLYVYKGTMPANTSITIQEGTASITDGAFSGCAGLTAVTIPNSVTSIGAQAFSGCAGLTAMTIPNGVTAIGSQAFQNCLQLRSISISESVTAIGNRAFDLCRGLTEVIVSEQNTNYSTLDGVLFNKDKTTLIVYPIANATTYIIPNGVTTIEQYAFYWCRGLTSVTIPKSVTTIGVQAFAYCTDLTEIHVKNPTPQNISYDAFNKVFQDVNTTTCKLYVPKGSYVAYGLAYVWSDFFNIIEEEDGTAINTISNDNVAIHSTTNGIAIATQEAAPVAIFNIAGQQVYQSVINGSREIALSKGVYIVRVGKESHKVIVQ